MGIGDSLKGWAKSKATEFLTADQQKAEAAAADAEAHEQQAKDDVGQQLLRTAFPKLGEWQDQQEEQQRVEAETRDREYREGIAALPLAGFSIGVSGWTDGSWSGSVHAKHEVVQPDPPDPEYPDSDPYAYQPYLSVELHPQDGEPLSLGGHDVVRWGFQVPGYTGDGTYDLTAIAKEREAAGAALTCEEWVLEFADHSDAWFYFYSEAGPSSVTVADGGNRLTVAMGMSGAMGDLKAAAEITLAG